VAEIVDGLYPSGVHSILRPTGCDIGHCQEIRAVGSTEVSRRSVGGVLATAAGVANTPPGKSDVLKEGGQRRGPDLVMGLDQPVMRFWPSDAEGLDHERFQSARYAVGSQD